MDNVVSTEILEDIDLVVLESTINVFDALLNEYEKASIILENADEEMHPGFSLFQEESVIDYATGKHSGDSTFMKVVKFIPRLFIGIIKAIGSVFTKDQKKDRSSSSALAEKKLSKASDNELTIIASETEKQSNGNIKFDPKKRTFVLTRGFKHIRNSISIILTAPALFRRIRAECKSGNTDYKNLAKELKNLLTGKRNIDETTASMTLTALNRLLDDTWTASTAVAALSEEISLALEKKMTKDFKNGKNIDKEADAKELLDQLSAFSRHVSNVSFFGKITKKTIDFFGQDVSKFIGSGLSYIPIVKNSKTVKNMRDKGRTGSENLVSAIGNKVAMSVGTQQEIDELDDLEGLNEGLRNKASGNDQTSQDKMKLHDKRQKLREKINHRKEDSDRLKDLNDVTEQELKDTERIIRTEDKEYSDTGEVADKGKRKWIKRIRPGGFKV